MATDCITIIGYIYKKVQEVVNSSMNKLDDNLSIEVKFQKNQTDRNLHLKFQSKLSEGTIGIWFDRKTMDISVWERQNGESLYEFHNIISNCDEIKFHFDAVIKLFYNLE